MMSVATIREINREVADRAREEGVEPKVFDSYDLGVMHIHDNIQPLSEIPNIGPLLPDGWERVDIFEDGLPTHKAYSGDADGYGAYLVDKTGLGSESEPALTISSFMRSIRAGYGYAIVEEGPFQIKIGVFRMF